MNPEITATPPWPSDLDLDLVEAENPEAILDESSERIESAEEDADEGAKPAERIKTAEQSIIIDRPLPDVFAAGSALHGRSMWQRGIVKSEPAETDCEGPCVRWIETRSAQNGETETWELEITELDQDVSLTIVALRDPVRAIERHSFQRDPSSAGRTRYTLAIEMTGSSLTVGSVHKQIVDNLIHFRDCVETSKVSALMAGTARAPKPGR